MESLHSCQNDQTLEALRQFVDIVPIHTLLALAK